MQSTKANAKISSTRIPQAQKKKPAAFAVSTPSSSEVEISAVAPPEVESAAGDKAAVVVQPKAPLLALEGWGLASYSSSDEEGEAKPKPAAGAKKVKPSAGNKTAAKSRTPSKEKYLLSASKNKKSAAQQDQKTKPEDDLFTRGATAGFGDELLTSSAFDPFADGDDASSTASGAGAVVHLRWHQRNGRKSLTTVQGISAAYNYAKILRDLKRELCCNGIVVEDEELGSVIQLQGDHRKAVAAFIVKAGMATKANVKIHGA
ncbi:hypothetical protein HU200_063500 [Digitaria exilis]|uniref:Protein translation factor SUI1 homolog n=1 Tax=Digitaria exilis TaxID=1010633 RepID=A0A835AB22_9POAL|nr:hypothetical protein HU200_063500 [Digitaria exilis]